MKHSLDIPCLDLPLQMYVHREDDLHISRRIAEEGVWEPWETELVTRHLRRGHTFVDVGANIGYYSVVASALVGPQGRVLAYEPDEQNYALLERNCALNGMENVVCTHAALSDRDRSGYLYLNEENRGDHQIYDADSSRDKRPIELLHGSTHVEKHVPRVDFIKVDTQGAELQVMRGLERVIRASLPGLTMILEFWPLGLRRAGASGEELLDFLSSLGLEMYLIDHGGHTLIRCVDQAMKSWIRDTDADPTNEGFIDVLLT